MSLNADGDAPRVRILCREGDDYGVVVDRGSLAGDRRIDAGEHRLHLLEAVGLVLEGAEVLSGVLELPVHFYFSSVDNGTLSAHLFKLPGIPADAGPLELEPRGRYEVGAVCRAHGARGPVTALWLQDSRRPGQAGRVDADVLARRLLRPPGATCFVRAGDRLLPVVPRLTTHLENLHENDLIGLPGCKGKWGHLEALEV